MHDRGSLLPSPFLGGSAERGFDVERLPSPAVALARFFAAVTLVAPAVEEVDLAAAAGRVLARDALAREDIPTHPRSTMDGFAMASAAGAAARRIVGEVAMGHAPARAIRPDEAMHVPTGGAIPEGADVVVPVEDCRVAGERSVVPHHAPAAGDCIAQRASDIVAGELVLRAGRRLGGSELGVLATLGIVPVPVYARPRIAIVSTGDELVDPGEPLAVGRIRDSNRYAIGASLESFGATAVQLPRVADRPDALRAALRDAIATCDAVITSGGSSVGERDLVPQALADLGVPGPIVHGMRVKPGKPTLLGAVGAIPVIGLPGNPTSSLMILEAVVRPIVRALCAETSAVEPAISAIAAGALSGRAGWTWYVPVRLSLGPAGLSAHPLAMRSSQTSLLARSGGYVTLDERMPALVEGARVEVTRFASGGAPIENR